MGWSQQWGLVVFAGVPLLLWALGALANRGHGFGAGVLGFVVGSDNRLSLSRLQAFFWTLIIFGSYIAAMAVHTRIGPTENWINIPGPLLALAGIAVGSGVCSSFIAAVNGDQSTARISSLASIPQNDAKFNVGGEFANASRPQNPNALLIAGTDLGDGGKVRVRLKGLHKRPLTILLWKSDGTGILVDLPDNQAFRQLIVETPNGKLTYDLSGSTPGFILGQERINYELADLFRDDKNPESLSLMKFQMFGWTVIAIFTYVYLFCQNLRPDMPKLPVVDPSIVTLTGVSQAGYLTGKGVSNISANP